MKWYEILWGRNKKGKEDGTWTNPDPDDLSIDNAYKTRWVWYHTILAIELFMVNVLLVAILVLISIKL